MPPERWPGRVGGVAGSASTASVPDVLGVGVCDFWVDPVADAHPLVRLLVGADGIRPTPVEHADLVVYGAYGFAHHRARGTRLAVSVEPHERAIGAHWTIDSRLEAGLRHLHIPPWVHFLLGDGRRVEVVTPVDAERPHFCNFIVTNGGCRTRNAMFLELDRRRPVHSLGNFLPNHHDDRLSGRWTDDWHRSKLDVMGEYRFTLAFENSSRPGYTSEKLIDAWLAGSVPVYWGDPEVTRDFPTDGMLVLSPGATVADLAEQVLAIDDDPDRYRMLQEANPFRTGVGQQRLAEHKSAIREFGARVRDDVRQHSGSARTGRVGARTAWAFDHLGRFGRAADRARGRVVATVDERRVRRRR